MVSQTIVFGAVCELAGKISNRAYGLAGYAGRIELWAGNHRRFATAGQPLTVGAGHAQRIEDPAQVRPATEVSLMYLSSGVVLPIPAIPPMAEITTVRPGCPTSSSSRVSSLS
jgi:hypothetical protein